MNRRRFLLSTGAAATVGFLGRGALFAQGQPASVRQPVASEFKPLRRNVGVFTARGGSIGWLSSKDALVAVDTQFADTAEIFLNDLPGRNGRKLDVVVNTHHHGDHTGGNATMRPATKSIVAHANVPELMRGRGSADNALDPAMVPDATFAEQWRREVGDEVISAKYFGPAHTRGDIVVLFEKANVVHMGDLMFNRMYPVIDRPGGASIRNWVKLLEKVAKEYPSDAQYIFGHGNAQFGVLGGPADLLVFRDYLSALLAHVEAEIKAGKSKEEVLKLENLAGFPDFHVPAGRGNRLPMNLGVAYDELSGA